MFAEVTDFNPFTTDFNSNFSSSSNSSFNTIFPKTNDIVGKTIQFLKQTWNDMVELYKQGGTTYKGLVLQWLKLNLWKSGMRLCKLATQYANAIGINVSSFYKALDWINQTYPTLFRITYMRKMQPGDNRIEIIRLTENDTPSQQIKKLEKIYNSQDNKQLNTPPVLQSDTGFIYLDDTALVENSFSQIEKESFHLERESSQLVNTMGVNPMPDIGFSHSLDILSDVFIDSSSSSCDKAKNLKQTLCSDSNSYELSKLSDNTNLSREERKELIKEKLVNTQRCIKDSFVVREKESLLVTEDKPTQDTSLGVEPVNSYAEVTVTNNISIPQMSQLSDSAISTLPTQFVNHPSVQPLTTQQQESLFTYCQKRCQELPNSTTSANGWGHIKSPLRWILACLDKFLIDDWKLATMPVKQTTPKKVTLTEDEKLLKWLEWVEQSRIRLALNEEEEPEKMAKARTLRDSLMATNR